MRERINDCVRCEVCIGCGGNRTYFAYICDICGSRGDEWDPVYNYAGKDYCADCLIKKLEEDGVIERMVEDDY